LTDSKQNTVLFISYWLLTFVIHVSSDVNLCNINHLMTGPEGNSEFCFPRVSMFPETKSRETLRFEGNKIHCYTRGQS